MRPGRCRMGGRGTTSEPTLLCTLRRSDSSILQFSAGKVDPLPVLLKLNKVSKNAVYLAVPMEFEKISKSSSVDVEKSTESSVGETPPQPAGHRFSFVDSKQVSGL